MSNTFQRTFQFLVDSNDLLNGPPIPLLPTLHPAPTLLPAPTPQPVQTPLALAAPLPQPAVVVPSTDAAGPSQPTPAISFVPGRRSGSENAVLAGHRYCRDRKRGDKEYWKCTHHADGCRARLTTEGRQLISTVLPNHSHDIQHSEIMIHKIKQSLKRKAATSDNPT